MSRVLGIDTSRFLSLYTVPGGTTLRADEEGRCVFSTSSGCRVHARRPLVCRLYPLGRKSGAGEELFAVFEPEPGCEAVRGREGTIETFLESQGIAPYFEWSRRYGDFFRRIVALLERLEDAGTLEGQAEGEIPEKAESSVRPWLSDWQDIDASLAEYCAAKGIEVPVVVEDAIALHLKAMGDWLDDLEAQI
jgi:hypothetical protein